METAQSKRHFPFSYVKHKLVLTFTILSIIPVAIISFISIRNARKQLTDQYQSLVSAEAARLNSTLFDITLSTYTATEPLLTQYSYQQLFSTESFGDENRTVYADLESTLSTMRAANASISSIHIYTDNPHIPTSNNIISCTDYSEQEWFVNLNNAINKLDHWSCTNVVINQLGQVSYQLTLSRRLVVSRGKYSAYLVITLDSYYIQNRLLYTDYYILTTVNRMPVFLSSDSKQLQTTFPFPEDFHGGYYQYIGAMNVKENERLTCIDTFATYKTNDKFYILVSDLSAYEEINQITHNYLMISFLAFLFPGILILFFSTHFSSRVITLRKAMHQASQGDYNIIDSFQGNDELTQTFEDLKQTIQLIQAQKTQIYEGKLARQQLQNQQQQMEYKILANQINPHFLFNTLEAIRMQALGNQNREVAESVKLLGKAMHYVLENTGTNATTLNRELDYIRVYLSIQQLRFPDRIQYELSLDNMVIPEQCRILPLLLQPLVENSVVHGINGIKQGLIRISIQKDSEEHLRIEIWDNGVGIKEDVLQRLNNPQTEAKIPAQSSIDSGIAIYNIQQRIRLYYGTPYGICIDSIPGHGTTVTLLLPYITQE